MANIVAAIGIFFLLLETLSKINISGTNVKAPFMGLTDADEMDPDHPVVFDTIARRDEIVFDRDEGPAVEDGIVRGAGQPLHQRKMEDRED